MDVKAYTIFLIAVASSTRVNSQATDGSILHSCNFGEETENWCGYTQTHNIKGLKWTSMRELNGNRFVGVEMVNQSTIAGITRLVSPIIVPPAGTDKACLKFRYQFTGTDLVLLHVVANVYNSQLQRNDQWYRRKPLDNKQWREEQLAVELPSDAAAYIQLTIDVTSTATRPPLNESTYGKVAIDDILLDLRSDCLTRKEAGLNRENGREALKSSAEMRTNGPSVDSAKADVVIDVVTIKPKAHLAIVNIG